VQLGAHTSVIYAPCFERTESRPRLRETQEPRAHSQVLLDLELLPVDHPLLPLRLQWLTADPALTNAASVTLWLDGGLVARLLRILRALPSECHTPHAAVVCAAAAAVITNLLVGVDGTPTVHRVQAKKQLSGDAAAMMALLQCGVLHPSAAQQLPADCTMHLERCTQLAPNQGWTGAQCRRFWTPRAICMQAMFLMKPALPGALLPAFLEQALAIAIASPCGTLQHVIAGAQLACPNCCAGVQDWWGALPK
jgi:hypothetical protein